MKRSTKKLSLKKFQIVKLHQTHPIRGGGDPTTGPKSKDMNDPACMDTTDDPTQGG